MSVNLRARNIVPPLGSKPRPLGIDPLMPALKEPATTRPIDKLKTKKVRNADVQLLLQFLRETFDLEPTTSPADTVCKLRLKMSHTDAKINTMNQQLLELENQLRIKSREQTTNKPAKRHVAWDHWAELEDLEQEIASFTKENKKLLKKVCEAEKREKELLQENEKNYHFCESLTEKRRESPAFFQQCAKDAASSDHLTRKPSDQIQVLHQERSNLIAQQNLEVSQVNEKLEQVTSQHQDLEQEIASFTKDNEKLLKKVSEAEKRENELIQEIERNYQFCKDLTEKYQAALEKVKETESLLKETEAKNKKLEFEMKMKPIDPFSESGDCREDESLAEKENCELKETIEDLKFKIYQQDSLNRKLKYDLTVFHRTVLKEKDSMFEHMTCIERAVVERIYSKGEVKTINSDDLSLWNDSKVNDKNGDLIGQGSFGKVFLRRYLDETVAVKVPYSSACVKDESANKRKRRIRADHARTTMEAYVHLTLADHRFFPKLYGIVDFEGSPSLLLEFLGDKKTGIVFSLSHAIKYQFPSLSPSDWFDIMADITQGVKFMHETGLLHNDLKANNILLQQDQEARRWQAFIIDMGNVSTMTIRPECCSLPKEDIEQYKKGTLFQHLAPEYILELEPVSVQTDVYALGKLLSRIERVIKSQTLEELVAAMTNVKPRLRPSWKHIERTIKKAKTRRLS